MNIFDERRYFSRLTLALVTMVVLVTFLPATALAQEDAGDSRVNATVISTDTTVTGTIPGESDEDWYAIQVQRGETINLTTSINRAGNLKYSIIDPAGNQIAGIRGGSGDGTFFGGATARQSGTHYVRVHYWFGDAGADYSLTVETTATTDDEPNESPDNATRFSLNASVEDTLSLGDTDWYAFDLERGDSVNVSGSVTGAGGIDFSLEYQNRTTFAGEGNVGSGQYAFNGTAPYTGTYYVHVRQSSAPGPDYTLEVQSDGANAGVTDGDEQDGDAGDEDDDEQDDQQGSGVPILPIVLGFVLVVVLIAVFLWRRDTDEQQRDR